MQLYFWLSLVHFFSRDKQQLEICLHLGKTVLDNTPSMDEGWTFSGTTQCVNVWGNRQLVHALACTIELWSTREVWRARKKCKSCLKL